MAIFTVTTLDDEDNGTGGLSLREAVLAANAAAGADEIRFNATLADGTIALTFGEIAVTDMLTINGDKDGDGVIDFTVDAGSQSRIFSASDDLSIAALAMRGGFAGVGASGGAISLTGATLEIENSSLMDSKADGNGGAIYADGGDVSLTDVVLGDNSAKSGGAIAVVDGDLDILRVAIGRNDASEEGGGVFGGNATKISIDDSTITSNTAQSGGGIALRSSASGSLDIDGSNIAGNSAATGAGLNASKADDSRVVLTNSLIGTGSIIGSQTGDTLYGDQADNTIDLHKIYLVPRPYPDIPEFADGMGGDDTIIGGATKDTILGGSGNDSLTGLLSGDNLSGGGGDDTIHGDGGLDTIHGDQGADRIYGDTRPDRLFGDGGADSLFGGDGNDTVDGGAGFDHLSGGTEGDTIRGGVGNDLLAGNDGDDIVLGGKGRDTVNGGDGADSLEGGNSKDTLRGGDGNDVLTGQGGDDFIKGDTGDDVVLGEAGNDQLFGDFGVDTLDGGSGTNHLTGGGDVDYFVVVEGGYAIVEDYADNRDFLALTDDIYNDLTFSGDTISLDGKAIAQIVGFDTTTLTESDFSIV